MKKYTESIIDNYLELTIFLFCIVIIAFMITGGCGGDGKSKPPLLPTGPPPECVDNVIDPECPAASFTELCDFWGYSCHFMEQAPEIPEAETIKIGIRPSACISIDCFTLECEGLGPNIPEMTFLTLNIIDIDNPDVYPQEFSGIADINGQEFDYICPPPAVP